MKTRVVLKENLGSDPYYCVQIHKYDGAWYWATVRCFIFRWNEGGVWCQQKAMDEAIELAKRIEIEGESRETLIYETPDISLS